MEYKRLRLEVLIAVCALLISSIAALASVYQSHVISQQLSAAVWPYLSVSRTFDPRGISLSVTNYGVGPALVRSAQLELDGKPMASWDDVLAAGEQLIHRLHLKGPIGVSDSNLDASIVLSPGVTRQLLVLRAGSDMIRAERRIVGNVSLSVCYCSLLGQCWQAWSGQNGSPVARSSCPIGAIIAAPTPTP